MLKLNALMTLYQCSFFISLYSFLAHSLSTSMYLTFTCTLSLSLSFLMSFLLLVPLSISPLSLLISSSVSSTLSISHPFSLSLLYSSCHSLLEGLYFLSPSPSSTLHFILFLKVYIFSLPLPPLLFISFSS